MLAALLFNLFLFPVLNLVTRGEALKAGFTDVTLRVLLTRKIKESCLYRVRHTISPFLLPRSPKSSSNRLQPISCRTRSTSPHGISCRVSTQAAMSLILLHLHVYLVRHSLFTTGCWRLEIYLTEPSGTGLVSALAAMSTLLLV